MSSKTASQRSLNWVFNSVVKSDPKEWDMTSKQADGKFRVVREFEHRATKDKLRVVEIKRYDPGDEMDVTYTTVSGSYKGREVTGALISKPRLD